MKERRLSILGFALVFASGCVSTVSEPSPLKAVVSNAEAGPKEVESARQRAAQQRELHNQREQLGQRFGGDLRQPSSLQLPLLIDDTESQEFLDEGTPYQLTYSDLDASESGQNQGITRETSGANEARSGEELIEIETKGLPVIPGARLLGVVSAKSGITRYMVKQQGQVAAVATGDNELLVAGRRYRIKGTGAEGVVVEDDQGQSFLIRR